ncbi:DUF6431 domain-containing protein [Helicovermis profundi]|nr:hypothetical protein HLPR_15960 [Clostridia bacterium S502]BEP29274.1 hypothetical protein HLPR_16050 [Clostridia bacterium S502]BEP29435.1 hypothetical protein HLPR_17660 [Clostridia bacterium S502]BEP30390.1 hypothetical protein HLPR_27210 [Clostridia bacterium S502]
MIDHLPFHRLSCSCGQKGCLIKHAYYKRFIKISGKLYELKILRLICKCCGKTESVLPSWIVPYSQILLKDIITVIQTYLKKLPFENIMINNLLIDESNIRYIIRQFNRHWRERLAVFKIPINHKFTTIMSFKKYNRQFMQIKSTSNILFNNTHIT